MRRLPGASWADKPAAFLFKAGGRSLPHAWDVSDYFQPSEFAHTELQNHRHFSGVHTLVCPGAQVSEMESPLSPRPLRQPHRPGARRQTGGNPGTRACAAGPSGWQTPCPCMWELGGPLPLTENSHTAAWGDVGARGRQPAWATALFLGVFIKSTCSGQATRASVLADSGPPRHQPRGSALCPTPCRSRQS